MSSADRELTYGEALHEAVHQEMSRNSDLFVFGLGVIGPDPPVPEPKFTVRDSCTRVPDAPGLGVEIDEEALKRLTLYRAEVTEKA